MIDDDESDWSARANICQAKTEKSGYGVYMYRLLLEICRDGVLMYTRLLLTLCPPHWISAQLSLQAAAQ